MIPACQAGKFTTASDVWSFGITAIELFRDGRPPYGTMSIPEVTELLASGGRHTRPKNCHAHVYALLQRCWHDDPDQRPLFGELATLMAELVQDLGEVLSCPVLSGAAGSPQQ